MNARQGMDDLIAEIDGKLGELEQALQLVLYHRLFGTLASALECELYCKQIDAEINDLEKQLVCVTPEEIRAEADFIETIRLVLGTIK